MSDILMVLKTQNLRNDQRVLKEMKSLAKNGANVELFVSKNCDLRQDEINFPMNNVRIFGGAAPDSLLLRLLGVFQFYIKALIHVVLNNKKYEKIWICDPIMFGLVILLKLIKPKLKIIWDHHELPPTWFLNNKLLMFFFKFSYIKADIVIHTNTARKDYLENNLKYIAKKSYIISNYPEFSICDEELLTTDAEDWINNNKFIYLQNSLQDNRYGADVIRVALESGFKIFHAGKINEDYIVENNLDRSSIFMAGYLNSKQINRVLNKSEFTVILYKQDSLNQKYCDANRLYQAMSIGVPIILGDNPTMVEATINYKNKFIINEVVKESLVTAISNLAFNDSNNFNDRISLCFNWCEYDLFFKEIVNA